MIVKELIALLGFQIDETALGKAERAFNGLIGMAQKLGFTLAGGLGIRYLANEFQDIIEGTAEAGFSAEIMARKFGLTTTQVQELIYVAKNAGIELDTLGMGFKFLQRNAQDAKTHAGDASKGFTELGINMQDAAHKNEPTLELFKEIADKLSKVEDAGKRTQIALKIFGRGGIELVPFLLQGRQAIEALMRRAEELGYVMGSENTAEAAKLQRSFIDLDFVSRGLRVRLANELIPTVREIIDAKVEWYLANRKLIDKGLKQLADIIKTIVKAGRELVKVVQDNARYIEILAAVIFTRYIPAIFAATLATIDLAVVNAKAAAAAAADWLLAAEPFLVMIAAAVIFAAILEDVMVYAEGGESAIGDMIKEFRAEAFQPDAHPIIVTIAWFLDLIGDAIDSVNEFFDGFFKRATELGGITEALKDVWATAVHAWGESFDRFFQEHLWAPIDKAVAFFKKLGDWNTSITEKADAWQNENIAGPAKSALGMLEFQPGALVNAITSRLPSPSPYVSGVPNPGGTGNRATVSVAGSTVTVPMTVMSPGASAEEIASASRAALEEYSESERQNVALELSWGVVR